MSNFREKINKVLNRKSVQTQSRFDWTLKSIRNLVKVGVLTPKGILNVTKSIYKHGANLMVLLEFASLNTPNRLTLNDQLTYQQNYQLSLSLAYYLNDSWQKTSLSNGNQLPPPKVAFLCVNHMTSLLTLFATARLGADITLLNTDMSHQQIAHIIEQQGYDIIIGDDELAMVVASLSVSKIPPIVINKTQLDQLIKLEKQLLDKEEGFAKSRQSYKLKRHNSGKINVLTGGTSGRIKLAKREPSIFAMLMPFLALLNKVELAKYQSVYVAVPFYHGYGLASVIISTLLSARIFMSDKFDTVNASELIQKHQIEALIIVPTMLSRLLEQDNRLKEHYSKLETNQAPYISIFSSVKRIISGGAKLEVSLVKQILAQTGDTLFNLYGTSEAGFGIMATPTDLHRYPDSIGKAIRGVRWAISPMTSDKPFQHTDSNYRIGVLSLGTAWSMDNSNRCNDSFHNDVSKYKSTRHQKEFISTGDLAYANDEGYLFLKGRADDMIVSGGENVYPADIENVFKQHPKVTQVAVIAIDSEEFGKRLVAFVSLDKNGLEKNSLGHRQEGAITEASLKQWLKSRLARYQMPKKIVLVDALPMTKTGKVSHQKLKAYLVN